MSQAPLDDGTIFNLSNIRVESNGTRGDLVNITTTTNDRNISQNSRKTASTDQLLQTLLSKISAIEDFLIRFDVKLDFATKSERQTSNKNTRNEIDMDQLKSLGLPAESAENIEKLEANLKADDFKKKLVSKCF